MTPKISILIVNWRSKDYLRRCLITVRDTCASLSPEVIVVDGGSFDGCDKMLEAEFPEVIFVQSQQNIGFGLSNNLGFEKVTAELLLLLNPDTELRPGAISIMITELLQRPDAGILGPKLLNTDGSLQKSCARALPTPLNQALGSEFLMKLAPHSGLWGTSLAFSAIEPVIVEAVSGACMLLRSDIFRRLGGFSPAYFMYGEDMDLCARVNKLGLHNYHVPKAEIVHHGGGSSQTQVNQFSNVMIRVANETYMRLNHGRLTALYYRALQGLSAIFRVVIATAPRFLASASGKDSAMRSQTKWWAVLRWSAGVLNANSYVKPTKRSPKLR